MDLKTTLRQEIERQMQATKGASMPGKKGGTEMMTLHDLIHKATILDNMFSCEDVPIKWCGVEIRDLLFELINGDKPEEAAINIRALIKPEEGSGTGEVTFFELNGERYVIEK